MSYRSFIPKKLIDGKKIGKNGYYIAIPNIGYQGYKIIVYYDNKARIFENWSDAEYFCELPNKYGKDPYILGYFKWSDENVEQLGLDIVF